MRLTTYILELAYLEYCELNEKKPTKIVLGDETYRMACATTHPYLTIDAGEYLLEQYELETEIIDHEDAYYFRLE